MLAAANFLCSAWETGKGSKHRASDPLYGFGVSSVRAAARKDEASDGAATAVTQPLTAVNQPNGSL